MVHLLLMGVSSWFLGLESRGDAGHCKEPIGRLVQTFDMGEYGKVNALSNLTTDPATKTVKYARNSVIGKSTPIQYVHSYVTSRLMTGGLGDEVTYGSFISETEKVAVPKKSAQTSTVVRFDSTCHLTGIELDGGKIVADPFVCKKLLADLKKLGGLDRFRNSPARVADGQPPLDEVGAAMQLGFEALPQIEVKIAKGTTDSTAKVETGVAKVRVAQVCERFKNEMPLERNVGHPVGAKSSTLPTGDSRAAGSLRER